MAERLVKELTGGDKIRARRMREDFWEFTATHKIWMAANHKPVIGGTDYGIWRRVKLIPFNVIIPDDEQDKQLPEKLLEELPGILNWALSGCRKWLANKSLGEPNVVRVATSEYKSDSDIVGQFIEAKCDVGENLEIRMSRLFLEFKEWSEKIGISPKSQMKLGNALNERGIGKRKSHGAVIRTGITLRNKNAHKRYTRQ